MPCLIWQEEHILLTALARQPLGKRRLRRAPHSHCKPEAGPAEGSTARRLLPPASHTTPQNLPVPDCRPNPPHQPYKEPATGEAWRCRARLPRARGEEKAHNSTGYFWVPPSTCFLTKLLWHHTCFCSSLEASAAWQMAECLHNECSSGSVRGGGSGTVTGGTGGQQGPSPGEAVPPSICNFAGETSHPVGSGVCLSSQCPQLSSSSGQSHSGYPESAAATGSYQGNLVAALKIIIKRGQNLIIFQTYLQS